MVGRTLADIHERLRGLATPDGPYYLACARTGERPTPSGDRRYPDRATAAAAAAVFESLSGGGFRDAERAVMDTYFDTAETVTDVDDLCLLLLRSMGAVLDETLDAHEQEVVLNRAASRLDDVRRGGNALDSALATLARVGLLADYHITGGAESHTVVLDEYALSTRRHVLTLPVAVELFRHRPGVDVRFTPTVDGDSGFRVTLADHARHDPRGLLRVPGV